MKAGRSRRKGATAMIESSAARNVCFSKRRQGLFRKAEELRRLIPNVSVAAIAFSPAGKPFVSGDPSSLLLPPPTNHNINKNEIDALLGLDITTLSASDLHSHRDDLLRLKTFLLSKPTEIPQQQEEDGSRRPSQMSTRCHDVPSQSGATLEIGEGLLANHFPVLTSMTANCDDCPTQSGFTLVESTGIQEDGDQEFKLMLTDLLDGGDANCDMDYGPNQMGTRHDDVPSQPVSTMVENVGIEEADDEEFDMILRELLYDGDAHCDMDHGPCQISTHCDDDPSQSGFTVAENVGIEEANDEEFDMILRDLLYDGDAYCDMDHCPCQMGTHCDDDPNQSGFTTAENVGIEEANNEELDMASRDLLSDGDANCDMDYGPSHNGGSRFSQIQSDGIEEDDDFGMMLTDLLNDDITNMDFDDSWLKSSGLPFCWNELITLSTKYHDLTTKYHDLIGGATISLFNTKKQLKTGKNKLRLWYGKEADGSAHTTTPGKVPKEERAGC